MAVDLHPDIVRAIRELSQTPLGRKYNRMAKRRYGVSGAKLAGKTVAGEFGGRSTKTGRGVVSSAGARGPAQFIPSTRALYMQRYGVDPWAGDRQAIKGMMLHHLNTGVEGYNPGMPTYKDYILGQKLNREDRRALRGLGGGGSSSSGSLGLRGPGRTDVDLPSYTIPGQSFAKERQEARLGLLAGGPITIERLLEYKGTVNSLKDVPSRKVHGDLQVTRQPGQKFSVPVGRQANAPRLGGGEIYEVFFDPLNEYWDSGGVQQGGIGDHKDHVHVSASRKYVIRAGKLAQRMGLNVGENTHFGGVCNGCHVEGSFHDDDRAIDVSGDPRLMRKFARIMMREAKRGRGR